MVSARKLARARCVHLKGKYRKKNKKLLIRYTSCYKFFFKVSSRSLKFCLSRVRTCVVLHTVMFQCISTFCKFCHCDGQEYLFSSCNFAQLIIRAGHLTMYILASRKRTRVITYRASVICKQLKCLRPRCSKRNCDKQTIHRR